MPVSRSSHSEDSRIIAFVECTERPRENDARPSPANVRSRVIRYRLPNFCFLASSRHDNGSQYCPTMKRGRRFAIKRAHSTWRLFYCTLTTINACCWLRRSSTIPGSESTGDTRNCMMVRNRGERQQSSARAIERCSRTTATAGHTCFLIVAVTTPDVPLILTNQNKHPRSVSLRSVSFATLYARVSPLFPTRGLS